MPERDGDRRSLVRDGAIEGGHATVKPAAAMLSLPLLFRFGPGSRQVSCSRALAERHAEWRRLHSLQGNRPDAKRCHNSEKTQAIKNEKSHH